MPTSDRQTATTILTATHARIKAFKTLLIQCGTPPGVTPPSALTISSVIDIALELATQAVTGAVVARDRRKRR